MTGDRFHTSAAAGANTTPAQPADAAQTPFAYTDPLYIRIPQSSGGFSARYEPDELFKVPLYLEPAAAVTPAEPVVLPEIGVDRMVESVNGVSWWPYIRVGTRKHHTNKYGAAFENRAQWEAALLRWVLLGADRPNIRDYMDVPVAAESPLAPPPEARNEGGGIKIRCATSYWARKVQILLRDTIGAKWGDDAAMAIPWNTIRLRLVVRAGAAGGWFISWVPDHEFDAVPLPEWDARALIAAAPRG